MKLAVVGSRKYKNEARMRRVIDKYRSQYEIIIVSGGCPQGGDALAKSIALSLELPYQEFPPIHCAHNQYCVKMPDCYNKSYHVKNYLSRNTEIAEYCDHLIAFIIKDVRCNGTQDTVSKARGLGKQVIVFMDIEKK